VFRLCRRHLLADGVAVSGPSDTVSGIR